MSLWTIHTQRRYRKNRRSCEDRGRDWIDAATSQERLGANRSWKRPGRILFQPMEGIQLILWFCTSGLQNYEIINSLVLSHKIWGNLLCWPKETNTPSSLPPISICLCVCGHVWIFATPELYPPGPSVHGISPARILELVAISFSSGSSRPRDQTCISCIAGGFFTHWATWEVPKSLPDNVSMFHPEWVTTLIKQFHQVLS